jgi:amino acid transporter
MNTTQSTPAGCFIGAISIVPLLFAGLGAFGLYRWWALPVESRHFDQRFWFLVGAVIGGLLVACFIIVIAVRILRATDLKAYDSRDPSQPFLKW